MTLIPPHPPHPTPSTEQDHVRKSRGETEKRTKAGGVLSAAIQLQQQQQQQQQMQQQQQQQQYFFYTTLHYIHYTTLNDTAPQIDR